MSLNEVRGLKTDIRNILVKKYALDKDSLDIIVELTLGSRKNRKGVRQIKQTLKANHLSRSQRSQVMRQVNNEISLNRRIDRLETMQNLFKHWHVAHLPFALIMLIIMVIHIAVAIVFGYTWIF